MRHPAGAGGAGGFVKLRFDAKSFRPHLSPKYILRSTFSALLG